MSLIRALVDQSSQASFIKKSLVNKLHLTMDSVKLPISGVGGEINYSCSKMVSFKIKPHFFSDYELEVEAFVLPKITAYAPNNKIKINEFVHLKSLVLTDPEFYGRCQIEVLLRASVHAFIIEGEVRRGGPLDPIYYEF